MVATVFILYAQRRRVLSLSRSSYRYIAIKFHRAPTSVFRQLYFSAFGTTFSRVICETSCGWARSKSVRICVSYELCGAKEFWDVNW